MIFLLTLAAGLTATAQSGRQIKKMPTPAPTPEPTVAPTPTPKPPVEPAVKFKIVAYQPPTIYRDFSFPENMPRWVVDRLQSSALVAIAANITGNQKDAKQIAVGSTDEFVVLLQLSQNSFDSPASVSRSGELSVEYSVFNPQTGKIRFRGSAYLRREMMGRGRRACYPTLRDADYMLWRASVEAADDILSRFNLPRPPEKCGGLLLNSIAPAGETIWSAYNK